jgi:hypothetical protein
VQAYIGRDVVASVFAITISGLYFLALAVIAFFARLLGVPFDRFTLNVLGLFAVFLLLAILISGRTKRRIRLFIEANFYASKYDYRKEWKRYSSLMGSSETIEEFLSNFISLLCETMMIERGVVWVDVKGGKFDFYGFGGGKPSFPPFQEVSERVGRESVVLFKDGPRARDSLSDEEADGKGERDLGWIRAIAAIGDRENRLGLVLLGAKSMELKYTEEDQEFLATLSDQATLTLENLLIKEQIIDTQQMESFNRFSSFVIHDLKNAIGMLSLTAENAKENINDPVFQKDAFDTIERSVEKMKGLIHSLGILKTPTEISKRRDDIAGIVRKTLSDLEPVADSRGNQLAFNAAGRIYGEVDASALDRIVENLVMNALDASGQGGQVSVSISRDGEEWIEISVEDSGKGFDPDFLRENLFRPFRSTKKGGLGIGLVMCKALVSAHGGDISIRSESGHGAIVTVRLPAFSRSAV